MTQLVHFPNCGLVARLVPTAAWSGTGLESGMIGLRP